MGIEKEKQKSGKEETRGQRESREKKERLAEIKKFRTLCVDYHAKHTRGWNMSSYEQDRKLYKRFQAVNVKRLPKELQIVYYHRLSYVRAIAELGANKRIRKFVLKFQVGIGEADLGAANFEKLYKKVNGSAEFKALTATDFKRALLVLKGSISLLRKIPSGGAWAAKASKLLKPDRVDDQIASGRLRKGFELILKNITKLQRRKTASA